MGSTGSGTGNIVLPEGGQFYEVGGVKYVVYGINDFDGNDQAWIYYEVPNYVDAPSGTGISREAWEAKTGNPAWIDGYTADAFEDVTPGRTWDDFINTALMLMGIVDEEALNDPGVLAVIAQWISRDMSDIELERALRNTAWGDSHTDREKTWNDKSTAQQEQEIIDQAFSLTSTWYTYTGEMLDIMSYDTDGDGRVSSQEIEAANPGLYKHALGIANGTMTSREVAEIWVKPAAMDIDQSPWIRIIQDEEKAKGAQEVGVETQASSVQTLYEDYGIPISWEEALEIGENVHMNRTSLAEIEQGLDEQAMALYPGKPPGVKTSVYAAPYTQQYKNLLEVADVGLDDPFVQEAMSNNMTLGDFSTTLRNDPRWMNTNNARDTHYTTLGQLGRQMGF